MNKNDLRLKLRLGGELICVGLLPPSLRSDYVEHIRVKYSADAIVYVLQALSLGAASIFINLLSFYLSEKVSKKTGEPLENPELKELISEQEETIEELRVFVNGDAVSSVSLLKKSKRSLRAHAKILEKVKNKDPEIQASIKKALALLKSNSANSLGKKIDSNWKSHPSHKKKNIAKPKPPATTKRRVKTKARKKRSHSPKGQ